MNTYEFIDETKEIFYWNSKQKRKFLRSDYLGVEGIYRKKINIVNNVC